MAKVQSQTQWDKRLADFRKATTEAKYFQVLEYLQAHRIPVKRSDLNAALGVDSTLASYCTKLYRAKLVARKWVGNQFLYVLNEGELPDGFVTVDKAPTLPKKRRRKEAMLKLQAQPETTQGDLFKSTDAPPPPPPPPAAPAVTVVAPPKSPSLDAWAEQFGKVIAAKIKDSVMTNLMNDLPVPGESKPSH